MSISTVIVRAFISKELAALEAAFESVVAKAEIAEPAVAAAIKLEVAKAQVILAKYQPEAEAFIAEVKDKIEALEADVVALAKKL